MQRVVYTCNHCGKELDQHNDYTDLGMDDFTDFLDDIDLCKECYSKLENMILEYLKLKKN